MDTARDKKEIKHIREKILESALDIIIQRGLEGLTMRHLASKTNMSAPNLYNYFSSKDEIYIHLIIKGFEMLYDDLKKVRDQHHAPLDRVRAMIKAYMAFGMNKPRYYDIMFTRPTPKYNDYIGTPPEKLSEIEYQTSMNIAQIAIKAASDVMGRSTKTKEKNRRLIQIWSLMHGMITLHNSQVVGYVVDSVDRVYQDIIDEFIETLTASP